MRQWFEPHVAVMRLVSSHAPSVQSDSGHYALVFLLERRYRNVYVRLPESVACSSRDGNSRFSTYLAAIMMSPTLLHIFHRHDAQHEQGDMS